MTKRLNFIMLCFLIPLFLRADLSDESNKAKMEAYFSRYTKMKDAKLNSASDGVPVSDYSLLTSLTNYYSHSEVKAIDLDNIKMMKFDDVLVITQVIKTKKSHKELDFILDAVSGELLDVKLYRAWLKISAKREKGFISLNEAVGRVEKRYPNSSFSRRRAEYLQNDVIRVYGLGTLWCAEFGSFYQCGENYILNARTGQILYVLDGGREDDFMSYHEKMLEKKGQGDSPKAPIKTGK